MTIHKIIFNGILIFFISAKGIAQVSEDSIISIDTVKEYQPASKDSANAYITKENKLPSLIVDRLFIQIDSPRAVSSNQVQSYLTDPDYAYANDPDYWKKVPSKKPNTDRFVWSKSIQWIIFILLILVILFGIIQLAGENRFSLFFRRGKGKHPKNQELEEDGEIDYDAAIRKYQDENNYRLAIRYLYLRLINSIRFNRQITIEHSSTNTEILTAYKDHPQVKDLQFLVFAYEHTFFGALPLKSESYEYIRNRFDNFQKLTAG